jgi:probable rRNA maturation factor
MKKINFEINNLTKDRIDRKFLEKIAKKTLKSLKTKLAEISLVFVSDIRMKSLNRKYRGRNRVTDVLAFDYGRLIGDPPKRMGEIIICLPQAKKQAKKISHSLKRELAILLIHGILHLVGYDDETKKGYNKMINKQKELWQKTI